MSCLRRGASRRDPGHIAAAGVTGAAVGLIANDAGAGALTAQAVRSAYWPYGVVTNDPFCESRPVAQAMAPGPAPADVAINVTGNWPPLEDVQHGSCCTACDNLGRWASKIALGLGAVAPAIVTEGTTAVQMLVLRRCLSPANEPPPAALPPLHDAAACAARTASPEGTSAPPSTPTAVHSRLGMAAV